MLNLVSLLIKNLTERDVEVLVWKGTNELQEAQCGRGDIDLYIRRGSRNAFLHCLQVLGFVEVTSPYNTPGVSHYYGYDAVSGGLCHLHCYFRIVTGESHCKQFILPIEPYLETVECGTDGKCFRELDANLQYKISSFRRQIKLSSLPGMLLYLIEKESYESERRKLANDKTAAPLATSGWMDHVNDYDTIFGDMMGGLGLRWRFRSFNRLNLLESTICRYSSIIKRLANKIKKRKKSLPQGISLYARCSLFGSGCLDKSETTQKKMALTMPEVHPPVGFLISDT